MMNKILRSVPLLCALLLTSACGGGGNSSPDISHAPGGNAADPNVVVTPTPPPPAPPVQRCTNPTPPEVQEYMVTSNVANAFDDRVGTIQPTTTVFVSVLLPSRCPEDRFPVVIESHGYSGAREMMLEADMTADPNAPHFPALDEITRSLPYDGYVVISFDERGHNDNVPANGGGYARFIDPNAETQDAIAVLDWAWDNAALLNILTEDEQTGIAKDIRVGTIGGSYGGGFQMPWAALDRRIDTIVPNGTWHNLLYSLMPGDGVKRGFDALLCLLADTGGVINTPVGEALCDLVGIFDANMLPNLPNNIPRTRAELVTAMEAQGFTEDEVVKLFSQAMHFFEEQQKAGEPVLEGGTDAFTLRPIPALFLQGNRDVLFNLTEAYWNWNYFSQASNGTVPVRYLTTEGAHMNPLANQVEEPPNCGGLIGVDVIKSWFDFHLKGEQSATYQSIPEVCISVTDTVGVNTATPVGLSLTDFPVGSQSGTGAVPARLDSFEVAVPSLGAGPIFLPVVTIAGDNRVLAGIPSIESLTVAVNGDFAETVADALQTPVAYVGTAIRRAGSVILVDDQVTSFDQGEHNNNRHINNDIILLPGVGEQLQDGDEVGLLFYRNQIQYEPPVSASSAAGVTGLISFLGGPDLGISLDALSPVFSAVSIPNPYRVTGTGIELPIIVVGEFPGSSLIQ